jgi:hypothetical protein
MSFWKSCTPRKRLSFERVCLSSCPSLSLQILHNVAVRLMLLLLSELPLTCACSVVACVSLRQLLRAHTDQ